MSGAARQIAEMDIYDSQGRRKYLTANERQRFRAQAERLPLSEKLFCLLFFFTGVRISEALEVTLHRVDLAEGVVIIRSLKRRKKAIFRAIPVPRSYLKSLQRMAAGSSQAQRLWRFSRKTGYRIIKKVMMLAKISGRHACRGGYVTPSASSVCRKTCRFHWVSRLMGHSSIKTTAIYLNAVGREARLLVSRIW